jgi:lipoprotein NlpD
LRAGTLAAGQIVAAALLAATLDACAPTSFEPVHKRDAGEQAGPVSDSGAAARTHEVAAGETLYSIAWESGVDYRKVASWNEIAPPYLIRPGQTLRLSEPEKTATAETPTVPAPPAVHHVRRGETLYRIALHYDIEVDDLARWNRIVPPYRITAGQTLRLAAPATEPEAGATAAADAESTRNGATKTRTARKGGVSATKKPVSPGKPVVPAAAVRTVTWAWPTEGAVMERFSNSGTRGIDVAGRKGQGIKAAGDGQVVYQGGGLRGYGQLIILKHNAEFLSAYAHCDRIHVKEGEVIKRGQRIADMGSSGTDRVKLHFEIRYRGTPVDPLRYLPKK